MTVVGSRRAARPRRSEAAPLVAVAPAAVGVLSARRALRAAAVSHRAAREARTTIGVGGAVAERVLPAVAATAGARAAAALAAGGARRARSETADALLQAHRAGAAIARRTAEAPLSLQ